MSGSTVSRALRKRFDAITSAEITRLDKKLRGLTDDERQSVEAITAEVIAAIAGVPERALAVEPPQPALAALVHLFALDP
jgi:hypothetical protein